MFHPMRCVAVSLAMAFFAAGAAVAGPVSEFTGYTRPGWPADGPGGKVIFAGAAGEPTTVLGGTIYFMVYERTGDDPNDPYQIGVDIWTQFRSGVHFSGAPSPHLKNIPADQSRFLYLYQVVNDRKAPAGRIKQAPIQSVSLSLPSDLRAISSWGYFDGAGFALQLPGEKKDRPVIKPISFAGPAWDGDDEGGIRFAFLDPAPRYSILRPLQMQKLLKTEKIGGKDKGVELTWDALDPPLAPNYVILLGGDENDPESSPQLRAIWANGNILSKNQRSTVVGFTSPYPPKWEPRGSTLRAPVLEKVSKPVETASLRDWPEFIVQMKEKPEILEASGAAPIPKPPRDSESPASPPGGAPGDPPGGGGGGRATGGAADSGGGLAGGSAPFAGFAASARRSSAGGGGSGSGGSDQDQNQDQSGRSAIEFNAFLLNQQLQLQAQLQKQLNDNKNINENRNGNGNDCCCGHESAVVPAPPAFFLAVLGLPVLAWLGWRRRDAVLPPA